VYHLFKIQSTLILWGKNFNSSFVHCKQFEGLVLYVREAIGLHLYGSGDLLCARRKQGLKGSTRLLARALEAQNPEFQTHNLSIPPDRILKKQTVLDFHSEDYIVPCWYLPVIEKMEAVRQVPVNLTGVSRVIGNAGHLAEVGYSNKPVSWFDFYLIPSCLPAGLWPLLHAMSTPPDIPNY
jgi:hypothetical protein